MGKCRVASEKFHPLKIHSNSSSTFWVILLTDRNTYTRIKRKHNVLGGSNETVIINLSWTNIGRLGEGKGGAAVTDRYVTATARASVRERREGRTVELWFGVERASEAAAATQIRTIHQLIKRNNQSFHVTTTLHSQACEMPIRYAH